MSKEQNMNLIQFRFSFLRTGSTQPVIRRTTPGGFCRRCQNAENKIMRQILKSRQLLIKVMRLFD